MGSRRNAKLERDGAYQLIEVNYRIKRMSLLGHQNSVKQTSKTNIPHDTMSQAILSSAHIAGRFGCCFASVADELVILCRSGQGRAMRERLARWLQSRGLALNEKKTRVLQSCTSNFEFLGFTFRWQQSK